MLHNLGVPVFPVIIQYLHVDNGTLKSNEETICLEIKMHSSVTLISQNACLAGNLNAII